MPRQFGAGECIGLPRASAESIGDIFLLSCTRNRANVMILAVRATHMTQRSCRGRESLSAMRPGPTVCGAWRIRSLTPTACRLPLQQGEDCLRAGIRLRQGEGAGL